MNFLKKNFNKILGIFILVQPFIDLVTGIFLNTYNINLTLGMIIRSLFLIFVIFMVTFVYKRKELIFFYLAILIYFIFFLIVNNSNLLLEIQGLLRTFYFPVLLISLFSIKDNIKINKNNLFIVLITYIILIFIPLIFNYGFKSYQITKIGTVGFFNSANEISAIISIITPIMYIYILNKKNIILGGLFLIIYMFTILMIGTKTPLLVFLLTIFMTIIYYFYKLLKEKKYKKVGYLTTIIIIFLGSLYLILPSTNFYKNIKTHLDYLELDNIMEVFKDKELVDHFIFSSRLKFLSDRNIEYIDSSFNQKLIGLGYSKEFKAVEIDYADIFYNHGIIGFIIYFTSYIYILVLFIKDKKQLTYQNYMLSFSLFLILILSFFTGHIITSPAVSFIVVLIILLLTRNKKRLLFTAHSLNVGGIEKALVTLLDNINYDKYEVDLILEKKEGIFLKRINENVTIKEFRVSENKITILRKLINYGKRAVFSLFNYHDYDFSCCYATYSLSGNKLAKIASKNSSLYVHGNYKDIYKNEEEFKDFFDKREIDKYSKIIFVSNESKKDFEKVYKNLKDKLIVINNFINIKEIKSLSTKQIKEKRLKDKKLLVFVGRLEEKSKRITRSINLAKELTDIELWLVGDGPDEKKYKDLVKENNLTERVKFMGRKENPYPYMKEADYILLTSDYEGFPVIYLEAITLNKGIITTIDVSDDYINIGKDYGYIVSKDEKKMVKEVKEILNKNKNLKEIDFNEIQNNRMKKLESIFDEVI